MLAIRPCYKEVEMPKLVDHDERRRLIAQATWRVISRDGVRAASVRTVAAEAGLSAGALRHYFDDHPSLLLFAAQHSLELMAGRVLAHLAAPEVDPRTAVQAVLEELLPLDAQRTAESTVYFGLIGLARVTPEHTGFREVMFAQGRRLYRLLVAWLAGGERPTLEQLVDDPAVGTAPLTDPRLEIRARSLQVFVDGLAVNALLCPGLLDADTVRGILDGELDRLVEEIGVSPAPGSEEAGGS
jgi:DNA-binding transcriptional regulator YbjK